MTTSTAPRPVPRPLPRPLSFSQMLVRAQWRHEERNPPEPAAAPAERQPAAPARPGLPMRSGATVGP